MTRPQATVARAVRCQGIGLHGGVEVELLLEPGPVSSGVVFVQEDAGGVAREIRVSPVHVSNSARATSVSDGEGARVATIEHLIATLYWLGIDNARVRVDGPEIPMMDGSALSFVDWIESAGRIEQGRARPVFEVRRPFEIRDGDRSICIEPHAGFGVAYAIDFDHPAIGRQSIEWENFDARVFVREVAGARTFGFEDEVESLRESGLALGGSFENAIVLSERGVLNKEGLRWPDEFVRHKVLDLLGDLALCGGEIRGFVRVERGGHALHQRLVRALVEEPGLLREPPQASA